MRGKLGVEKGKHIREGGRAPSEAVFRRPAVITSAAMLYTRVKKGKRDACKQKAATVLPDHTAAT